MLGVDARIVQGGMRLQGVTWRRVLILAALLRRREAEANWEGQAVRKHGAFTLAAVIGSHQLLSPLAACNSYMVLVL